MKAKISHPKKHEQDSKIMQLSDFPELSDLELELLVGGCYSNISGPQTPEWNYPGPVSPSPVSPGATS